MTAVNPVLELRNVTKEFPGVRALDCVNIHVGRNEVVGLIGENGAGKSTLVKTLAGIHRIDEGELIFEGEPKSFRSPRDAFNHGLAMVFQEQSIIQTLTVAENIFLGREREFLRFGVIDKRAMNAAAKVELAKVHLDCDPAQKCARLDFAARQMVEIAKALSLDGRLDGDVVILLDEPTSVLERREIDLLFGIIRELKAKASIIFISHRLDEVLEVSDRVYVLRDGAVVHETTSSDASITGLHEHMVGRQLDHQYYRENKQRAAFGNPVLSVRDLSIDDEFSNLSFELAEGEILGLAGVVGSGREAFARCLGGLLPPSGGEVLIDGKPVRLNRPHQAVNSGFGFVPSERKSEGIVTGLSVAENMTLAAGERFSRLGFIRFEKERTECQSWIDRLQIRTPSSKTPMQSLSGGNQQKVVLSKWQIFGSKVAVLDHPTRGIDVGAKEDVYELIREMADQGVAIVLLGDTLEEVIGLSNRILVLRDGEVSASFDAPVGGKPDQLDLISKMV
ncbi:MAG: sugar ABC transporter ATP-binding protein [Rhodobacteraceae bacterium]|nr:sugar ABC transporter ATP-binding protein [Paracoccaceae bacterium]